MGIRAFLLTSCLILAGCGSTHGFFGKPSSSATTTFEGIYRIDAAVWPVVSKRLTDAKIAFSGEPEKGIHKGEMMLFVEMSQIKKAKLMLATDSKAHGYVLKSAATIITDPPQK